jgi:hypothetical protein
MEVLLSLSSSKSYELTSRLRVWSDSIHFLKGAIILPDPPPFDRSRTPVLYERIGTSVEQNGFLAIFRVDVPERPKPHHPEPVPMVPMLQKDVLVAAILYAQEPDGLRTLRHFNHALKVSPDDTDLVGYGLDLITNLCRAWFSHAPQLSSEASSISDNQTVLPTGPTRPYVDLMQKTKPSKVMDTDFKQRKRKKKKQKVNVEGSERMDTQPTFHMHPRF